MPRYIIKIKDLYFDWSTVVDAPISDGMTLDQFQQYYSDNYTASEFLGLSERLDRVAETGCSALDGRSSEDVISGNRAGADEARLTSEQIYEHYRHVL